MNTERIQVPLSTHGQARLDIPAPLTQELLTVLEQSLTQTLARLRRGLSVDALDPALVEYASWMPAGRQ